MGRRGATSLQDVVGKLKDKASQSRAALNPLSKPHVGALLRATTHDPSAPPEEKHLAAILSYGHRSRATASVVVESLMDRLQTTGDAPVALKCLLTVHHIICRGTFILQDQLSVFPAAGGRNYLKLSNFRDSRSPFTWEISSWVRWYARYVENFLSASRILGFFIGSSSSILEKEKVEETVTGLLNSDLLRELDSLVGLIEDACKMPDSTHVESARLLRCVKSLAAEDHMSVMNEVAVRISEFRQRLSVLSFGESVELVCNLKRLEGCEEKLSAIFDRKVPTESFWELMREVKSNLTEQEEKMSAALDRRVGRGSESARYGGRRAVSLDEPVRFSSGRLPPLPIPSTELYPYG
ncbi:putative clathrin assembly protein At4g40080 [Punica granatum]|uniref:ENTH domain-containing protein n=2 Tax=Punica granatum TaxID=22663 RepID=A0A218W1N2_PUNGR|nr:putative clathrin assembly protein At4g40080 [Punica granatum]OWM66220.1 hypothetical protein CDL15_Pgr013437 [Punica granatum]PKI78425.1 hypothetical protein CRG98_001171 [Punica granatum]